jgi:hypothetical protein
MKWILICALFWQSALAQKVQIIVPKEPIIAGNAFQVQYIIPDNAVVEHVKPPVSDTIKLISGPNFYKGTVLIDGKQQMIQNIAFTLVASGTGAITIRSTSISFKSGQELWTDEAAITVVPPIKASFNSKSSYTDISLYAPSSKNDLDQLINENLFVRTEVDKKTCYVGEPVVAVYKLYSRLQSSSEVVNAPSLYGFTVTDMLNINEAHQAVETIGGKVFNTSVLRKLQLYPERSGELVIDAMELDNEIEFDDSLTGQNKKVIQRSIVSQPVIIRVRALPKIKPDGYSGAVGRFVLRARLLQNRLMSSEQGSLEVTISGKGNFIQTGPPTIQWPKGFDVFEPEIREEVNKNATPAEGSRNYIYHFTVDKPGSYTLPGLIFSYFNPAADSFVTLTTDSIQVEVVKAEKGKTAANISQKTKRSNLLIIAGAALLAILCFLWIIMGRRKKDQPVDSSPVEVIVKPSEKLEALDTSMLDEKSACFQIQKLVREIGKEYPLKAGQEQQLRSIAEECQLLAYSSVDTTGQKEALKERALILFREIES